MMRFFFGNLSATPEEIDDVVASVNEEGGDGSSIVVEDCEVEVFVPIPSNELRSNGWE